MAQDYAAMRAAAEARKTIAARLRGANLSQPAEVIALLHEGAAAIDHLHAAAALTQREQAMAVPADAPLVATPEGDRGPSALSGWQGAVERLQSGEPIQPPPGAQLREDLTTFALAEPERKFSTGAVGAWLGFALTSGFIEQTLGVPGEPGVGSKAARLWTRVQLDQIRVALIKHLQALRGPL